MQVDRLCTCGSQVIDFKVCVIIGISKIEFFNFSDIERVKTNVLISVESNSANRNQ